MSCPFFSLDGQLICTRLAIVHICRNVVILRISCMCMFIALAQVMKPALCAIALSKVNFLYAKHKC